MSVFPAGVERLMSERASASEDTFAARIRQGERPDYSLPQPKIQKLSDGVSMEVVTCFMAGRATS